MYVLYVLHAECDYQIQGLSDESATPLALLPAALSGLTSTADTQPLLEALVNKLRVPRFFISMEEDGAMGFLLVLGFMRFIIAVADLTSVYSIHALD